jgi:hypothetical protein
MTNPARCTAHRTNGQPCARAPIKGHTVCATHGGSAPQVKDAAARHLAVAAVTAELDRLGIPIPTNPTDALLSQLAEAAGNVSYLRQELQRQQQLATDADRPGSTPLVQHGQWTATVAPLVTLYGEWSDRMARLAKLALDAGVDERAIALAERLGALLADTLEAALSDREWGLTEEQRHLGRTVLGRHLKAVG